ncbi:hypothetical protein OG978_33745 [Streptomyces sp. NBC_01591]|uniref:hypothetical protein n=1 Tax=Streptomyces sp. NBC_01591 TaxID=2975888 RepID=UPI002DDBD3B3|nr:hypothetical protein [Streptomyces sp. NBC_01591]WSD71926.1 hypothetical protein OG978_33745 [Streptomyces sp. NBC_01591]
MSASKSVGTVVTVAAVLARAAAYGIRAARTKSAVERMKTRYEDRAASAKYLSEAMTRLDVDEPTTTAYMEVSTLGTAAAENVGSIVSASDALAVSADGLESETRAQHGRMADANRTHSVQMADRAFIERQ